MWLNCFQPKSYELLCHVYSVIHQNNSSTLVQCCATQFLHPTVNNSIECFTSRQKIHQQNTVSVSKNHAHDCKSNLTSGEIFKVLAILSKQREAYTVDSYLKIATTFFQRVGITYAEDSKAAVSRNRNGTYCTGQALYIQSEELSESSNLPIIYNLQLLPSFFFSWQNIFYRH